MNPLMYTMLCDIFAGKEPNPDCQWEMDHLVLRQQLVEILSEATPAEDETFSAKAPADPELPTKHLNQSLARIFKQARGL